MSYKENALYSQDITLGEFVPVALKQINRAVKKVTLKDREQKINAYLLPYFGDMPIKRITALRIEDWQYNLFMLRGSDLIRRVKQLLRRVLDRAIVYGIIEHNPVVATDRIRDKKINNREVYTKEEVKLMIGGSDGWLSLFIQSMVSLGLRSGEAIALKFSDIDFNRRTIKIERSIRKGVIGDTKTGETRIIDIPLELHSKFLKLYEKQKNKSDWIFTHSRTGGHYKDCSYITRRHFKPLLGRLNIEYKTLYSLRHTYATLSLQGGQNINYVSKQLGHKDIKTTLDYYVKYLYDEKNMIKADEILKF
ncbi:site-specific integrase [bacterium]|nr:site-specific integrase [bacterium]MBU1959221.1 site-specific integrase [bacterium]